MTRPSLIYRNLAQNKDETRMTAITIDHLSKSYGPVQALRTVHASIPQGHITGLLGPNGAGKTTLIKAVVGALQPAGGSVRVLGLDPLSDRWKLRQQLGYMPQEPALYDDLSALENVVFYARLHRIDRPREKAAAILTELDLGDRLSSPVHTLSGGMQKRVSLACALVHDPTLLILDEPTAALDPLLKRHLWERFRQLATAGRTLLISTHLIDEAMLCDSVILLQHGQLVAQDSPRNLIAKGKAILNFRTSAKNWTETVPSDGSAIAQALQQHGLSNDINRLDIETDNLEDVMVALLKEQKKE